jgi:hypothetical protein
MLPQVSTRGSKGRNGLPYPSDVFQLEREVERLRGLLAEVDAHYSGSLDHQPGYVKRIRAFLADAA